MYKRIILKLSGETLAPEKPEGAKSPTFDALRVEEVARVIGRTCRHGRAGGRGHGRRQYLL